jgi:pyruvate/2-oxoglutarate dehydrogenase complex dihydrolipoamide acyltransferase (E2) component
MPHPLYVPRVNNNDDQVTIVELAVKEREFVRKGQVIAAVETDKAVLEVEADRDGYVLKIVPALKAQASVGSVLLWLGDSAEEAVPVEGGAPVAGASGAKGRPTAGARARLKELGLNAEQIPAAGERLTEKDIEAYDKANPHFELECTECHDARPAEGATAATVKFKNGDKGNVDLCYGCHDASDNVHPIHVDPLKGTPPVAVPP